MASILFNSEMAGRRKRKKKGEDAEEQEKPAVSEEKSNDSKSASESVGSATPNAEIDDGNSRSANIPKKNIKECLRERPVLVNPTHGFNPLIDLWNVEKTDLEVIDNDCVSLLESSSVLNRFIKLKYVSKGINPTAMSDDDDIREVEMLTTYEDVAIVIKQEKVEETVTLPAPISIPVKEEPEDVKG